jgi:hypothetical protein
MEPPKEPPREPGYRSLKTAVGILIGLGVISAVVGYLVLSGDGSQQPAAAPTPKRGVACPHLRKAYEQRLGGNEDAASTSVRAAARAGEAALDKSGQAFGRPEEIALELEYAISNGHAPATDVSTLLEHARDACRRLGRWQPAS